MAVDTRSDNFMIWIGEWEIIGNEQAKHVPDVRWLFNARADVKYQTVRCLDGKGVS